MNLHKYILSINQTYLIIFHPMPGREAQWVTCPTAATCLTAEPVAQVRYGLSNTFVEIDHEIISRVILLPSADSRGVVVSYK